MITNTQYKGYLYFDKLNIFVLALGKRYYEDKVQKLDLLAVKDFTIKNCPDSFNLDDLGWDIATNIPTETHLFKYFKTMLPLTKTVVVENLENIYCDFIGCVFNQKLGIKTELLHRINDYIKLSTQEDKIIYRPELIAISYLTSYSQITSYFRP